MKQILPFMDRKIKLEDAVKHIETHSKDILDAYDLLILKNKYDIGKELQYFLEDDNNGEGINYLLEELYDMLGRVSPRTMSKEMLSSHEDWENERQMRLYAARRLFLEMKQDYHKARYDLPETNSEKSAGVMLYHSFVLLEEMIKRESKK